MDLYSCFYDGEPGGCSSRSEKTTYGLATPKGAACLRCVANGREPDGYERHPVDKPEQDVNDASSGETSSTLKHAVTNWSTHNVITSNRHGLSQDHRHSSSSKAHCYRAQLIPELQPPRHTQHSSIMTHPNVSMPHSHYARWSDNSGIATMNTQQVHSQYEIPRQGNGIAIDTRCKQGQSTNTFTQKSPTSFMVTSGTSLPMPENGFYTFGPTQSATYLLHDDVLVDQQPQQQQLPGMQRNVDSIEGVSHDARRWTPWQTDLAYNDTKHNQLSSRSSGHPPPSRLPPALVYRQEPRPSTEDLQRAWDEYNSNLAGVFERITKGDLSNAGQSLQELSKRLLESIPELGLDTDDEKLHDARLKLWENFNHAWLGLLQAQKDMSNSDGISKQSAKLIPELVLERMGKELVELCDKIEKYGLVDYQHGVWEQNIMHILITCLDCKHTDGGGDSS